MRREARSVLLVIRVESRSLLDPGATVEVEQFAQFPVRAASCRLVPINTNSIKRSITIVEVSVTEAAYSKI